MTILVIVILLACSITLVVPYESGTGQSPKQVEKWFENLNNSKHKITKLHFYFHELSYSTLNAQHGPTSVEVAKADFTHSSPTLFGSIKIADNPMTVGPERASRPVGRAQGLYGSASFNESALVMAFNFVFTGGPHKGSTLSLVGWNPAMRLYREMSIVGGSGMFRLARGVATAKTHFYDPVVNNATLEWNIVVMHY